MNIKFWSDARGKSNKPLNFELCGARPTNQICGPFEKLWKWEWRIYHFMQEKNNESHKQTKLECLANQFNQNLFSILTIKHCNRFFLKNRSNVTKPKLNKTEHCTCQWNCNTCHKIQSKVQPKCIVARQFHRDLFSAITIYICINVWLIHFINMISNHCVFYASFSPCVCICLYLNEVCSNQFYGSSAFEFRGYCISGIFPRPEKIRKKQQIYTALWMQNKPHGQRIATTNRLGKS